MSKKHNINYYYLDQIYLFIIVNNNNNIRMAIAKILSLTKFIY